MNLRTLCTLTAAWAFAACIAAPPAAADDQMFVDALDMIGVSVGDSAAAAAVGRGVCASFDAGTPLPTVVDRLADEHDLSTEDASLVTGFAVAEYCDRHEGALRAE